MDVITPARETHVEAATAQLDWAQRQNVRRLALISFFCVHVYAALYAFMVLTQLGSYASDPSLATDVYADYVRAGCFIFLGVVALGVAVLTLAAALARSVAPVARSRAGLYALCIVGVSDWLAALFPDDAPGALPTTAGTIHTVAALAALLCAATAPLLFARGFRNDARWRGYAAVSFILGVLAIAALIYALVALGFPAVATSLGVFSTAAVPLAAVTLLWVLLTTLRVRSTIQLERLGKGI